MRSHFRISGLSYREPGNHIPVLFRKPECQPSPNLLLRRPATNDFSCGWKQISKHNSPTDMPAAPCLLDHPAAHPLRPSPRGVPTPETHLRPNLHSKAPNKGWFVKPPHSSTQNRARVCVCQCDDPTNRGSANARAAFKCLSTASAMRCHASRRQGAAQSISCRQTHVKLGSGALAEARDAVRPLVDTCGCGPVLSCLERLRKKRGPVTSPQGHWPPI